MIVAVLGGRRYHNRAAVFFRLARLHAEQPITEIWHGAAGWDQDVERPASSMTGLDAIADQWAALNGVGVRRFPAAWAKNGKTAGLERTQRMLELLADRPCEKRVIVFVGGGPAPMRAFRSARVLGLQTDLVRERVPADEREGSREKAC